MSALIKPCPFCGEKPIPFGTDFEPRTNSGTAPFRLIKLVLHRNSPDDKKLRERCPLAGDHFPRYKWNRRITVWTKKEIENVQTSR